MTQPFGFKRIGKHTIVYAVGILLRRAVSFIMLPVYTRFLSPADYGVLELIEMTLDVVSIVAGARLSSGVFRFYHKAETEAEKRRVISTALVMRTATYLFFAALTYVSAVPLARLVLTSPLDAPLIRIAAVTFVFNSLLVVALAYLQVKERSVLFVIVNFVKLVIQLGLNIVLVVHFRMGVRGILISDLIANGITTVWLAVLVIRETGLRYDAPAARALLRYGLPLMATQVATFIMTFGDRYFLRAYSTLTVVGLYSLAYQFGFLLGTVGYTPFGMIWEPARFEVAKRPDRDALFARSFLLMNLLLVTVALGIALLVDDVLRVMAAPAFEGAATMVPVILVAYLLQCWSEVQNVGILVAERTEYVAYANWIGTAIIIVAYITLIPPYGGMGAALATAIAFGARQILIYYFSQRLWPVSYKWKRVVRLLGLAIGIWGISLLLPASSVAVSLAMRVGLLVVYGVGVWFLGILPPSDRETLRRIMRVPREAVAILSLSSTQSKE